MSKQENTILYAELQEVILGLELSLAKLEKTSEKRIQHLESDNAQLRLQIEYLKRKLFGASRERFEAEDNNQLKLPFDIEPLPESEAKKETITYERTKERKKHPGRYALPNHLPVEEVYLEPREDTAGMVCIGQEVTEQLEMVPARFFIRKYIRPKYVTAAEMGTHTQKVLIAELPSFVIPKGKLGSSVLAQVAVDKFVDHLPVHRQQKRFARHGIELPYNTLNHSSNAVCEALELLYSTLKHKTLNTGYLQVDETPVPVLDKDKKGKTHQGYYWLYHSPLGKEILVDYQKGRSRDGPKQLLKNFKGYLQTDGYNVYDTLVSEKKDLIHLNCVAHARRYFYDAMENDPMAEQALSMFQQLYAIEREARESMMTPEQRHMLRLNKALPIWDTLGKWIHETHKTVLPKSALGKAVNYCIPRWNSLMNYLRNGYLEIDNNLIENAVRPIALGRKNYLFAGSHEAAKRAAMMYSFFATCKANNVEPYAWLKFVLDHIQECKYSKLETLLPQNFNHNKPQ